ncbi:isochorismate synthase [Moraxella marmotae]|uniref:isochorismate synthase n=1 Tax=Moraxella marmotae TaxID=3344520 RepID=UPI0035F377C8
MMNVCNQKYSVNNQDGLFCKNDKCIQAKNLYRMISVPAINIDCLLSSIKQSLSELSHHGRKPIAMGAIPFDTQKPSFIGIYSDYKKLNYDNITLDTKSNLQASSCSHIIPQEKFKNLVKEACINIQKQNFEKVVLSQAIDICFNKDILLNDFWNNLVYKNRDAYNFSMPIDKHSYLFGATPELLISKHDGQVKSNPLAGSRKKSDNIFQNIGIKNELLSSQKDIYEHLIVAKNVQQVLGQYCKKLDFNKSPTILETSTMLHLSSAFTGELFDKTISSLELALALHPTPAVCGLPIRPAREFILNKEGYDRELYTGIVGWMDSAGNGEWAIAIRCGMVKESSLRLYAGAGIVTDSQPDLEWKETQAKMQTILNLFQ